MPVNFKTRSQDSSGGLESLNTSRIAQTGNLTNTEIKRLEKIVEAWNFYEGYHWEGIDDEDSPQTTYNYIRPFVNKFVAFELGKGFTFKTCDSIEKVGVSTEDTKVSSDSITGDHIEVSDFDAETEEVAQTTYDFLDTVWKYNNRDEFLTELGQTKSITGDGWVKVTYTPPEDLDDVFDMYPEGKIEMSLIPSQYVFPEFNQHDKDKIERLWIMYPIQVPRTKGILRARTSFETVLYKEVWTRDTIITMVEGEEPIEEENPYGIIPIVHFKNFPIAGRSFGSSDIDDLIPLNTEYNYKKSDMSEIIDYHSAPITLVYGAKIGNLEKGANKVWGGLPKDSKVENLSLSGDLLASKSFTDDLKTSMCEIGAMPETVLGGASAISNTSGVALQYMNGPLIERTNIKRSLTSKGLKEVNSLILLIAEQEGLIVVPESISRKDFFTTEVNIPDTLPKDELIELQKIQQELMLGLECRHGAMERLGKENIIEKIEEIDKEREEHPELFNTALQGAWYDNQINSGMTNGSTAIEEVRKEMTGQNGPQPTPQNL